MELSHSDETLKLIQSQLKSHGITEYKFCIENDCYICDIHGNVYSVCKRQHSKSGRMIEKVRIVLLNGSKDKDGYITYRITVGGIRKHLKGHRIMLNAWEKVQENLVVNHKDGNKTNNSLENLEWCTVAENNAHAIATGLFHPNCTTGKLRSIPSSEWISIYILYKHCGFSLSELGRMNGCSHDTVKKVIEKINRLMIEEVQYAEQ